MNPISTLSLPSPSDGRVARIRSLLRVGVHTVRDYYQSGWRRARVALTSLLLTFVGGAAMFWLHAIYRGEQGPSINHWFHWLLDSTLGFVALTPVIMLMIPMVRAAFRRNRPMEPMVVGALFALVTTPGPVLHNWVAGAGTPLADGATSLFGFDHHVAAEQAAAAAPPSMVTEMALQFLVGLPVYMGLAALAWATIGLVRILRAPARPINLPPVPHPTLGTHHRAA